MFCQIKCGRPSQAVPATQPYVPLNQSVYGAHSGCRQKKKKKASAPFPAAPWQQSKCAQKTSETRICSDQENPEPSVFSLCSQLKTENHSEHNRPSCMKQRRHDEGPLLLGEKNAPFPVVKILSAIIIAPILWRLAMHDWIMWEINCTSVINQCRVVAGVSGSSFVSKGKSCKLRSDGDLMEVSLHAQGGGGFRTRC